MTGYGYWTDKGIFQVAFGSYQSGRYIITPGNEGSNWYDIFPVFDPEIMYVGSRLITFDNGEGYEVTEIGTTTILIWADVCKYVKVKYTGTNRQVSNYSLVYNEDGSSLGIYSTIIVIQKPPYQGEWPSKLTGYVNYAVRDANERSTFSEGTSDALKSLLPSFPKPIGELPNDPYFPGGSSGTGGGTGNFDGTGDDIAIPGLPTLSAVDTGFITLFNPSISQLKSLSDYLWSGFDLNTFKKIFANPMDCILGLSIVPVSVPNGELKEVSVGNIPTGVSMTVAASQYVIVDCGTLNVNEFWGAYLDYDPYTKAEIYLPYIGTHPISVDDIMGKSVHVVYHIDILSGACTAFVKCGGSVLYEFIGQCSSSIPVTGNDWTNVINGVLSVSAAIGTMVATGGATAPMAASAIASTAVNSMKSNVEKSGSMSGTGGMLAVQTPYLILTRPRQAMPASQNKFMGYPSFITSKLGSLSGYTVVDEIHLENISGTEQELSEIENLLKTGVIL